MWQSRVRCSLSCGNRSHFGRGLRPVCGFRLHLKYHSLAWKIFSRKVKPLCITGKPTNSLQIFVKFVILKAGEKKGLNSICPCHSLSRSIPVFEPELHYYLNESLGLIHFPEEQHQRSFESPSLSQCVIGTFPVQISRFFDKWNRDTEKIVMTLFRHHYA